MERDSFHTYHPVISFLYFVTVIGCSMFVMHPVFLGLSFVGGFFYYVYLKGKKAWKTAMWLYIPVFLISALVNPLFNHEGMTVLAYFRTGNPLTLESVVYGMASGLMIVTVLNWFSCYQVVMTSDKFIYLFGKIIPAMSLILSMVFRFVPKFKIQIENVYDARKCIGRDMGQGNFLDRAKHGLQVLSVMTTWALENSVETADSMKARGYGLRGRTNFSKYRFDGRDKKIVAVMLVLGSAVLGGIGTKTVNFLYYPTMRMNENSIWAVAVYAAYGILCLLPIGINVAEEIKWNYLQSKI